MGVEIVEGVVNHFLKIIVAKNVDLLYNRSAK